MRVIENNILPFPGFLAISLFGIVFVRKKEWGESTEKYRRKVLNHEAIHTAQMKELLYVGFYILYLLEWIYRIIVDTHSAYRRISFEREAYMHQSDDNYLNDRKAFEQWRK